MTIIEYCNYLKIQKAYDLIRFTDQRIYEIAADCGFSSGRYFSRLFKRYVGLAPIEVRNQDTNELHTDLALHGKFQYRYHINS